MQLSPGLFIDNQHIHDNSPWPNYDNMVDLAMSKCKFLWNAIKGIDFNKNTGLDILSMYSDFLIDKVQHLCSVQLDVNQGSTMDK